MHHAFLPDDVEKTIRESCLVDGDVNDLDPPRQVVFFDASLKVGERRRIRVDGDDVAVTEPSEFEGRQTTATPKVQDAWSHEVWEQSIGRPGMIEKTGTQPIKIQRLLDVTHDPTLSLVSLSSTNTPRPCCSRLLSNGAFGSVAAIT